MGFRWLTASLSNEKDTGVRFPASLTQCSQFCHVQFILPHVVLTSCFSCQLVSCVVSQSVFSCVSHQSVCLSLLFPLVQHHVFECVYAIRDPLQPVQLFQFSRSSVSCPVHPLIITNTSLHLSVSPAFGASFPCIHTQHKPWHRLAKKNEHYQKQHRARKDCSHYVFNLCLK